MTSQINPNNIDGTYPVAGQPNNTQGMRDNFTATKTNFQYAADEINDLQNKAVLKSALTGSTLDNNMNDNLIYAVKMNDVSFTALQQTATAGTITIDYAAAAWQTLAPTNNVSLAFTNWPASGDYGVVNLEMVITNTAYTLTLPTSVTSGLLGLAGWDSVTRTITFYQTGSFRYSFSTVNGGTAIQITDFDRPRNVFYSQVDISNTTPSTSTTTGALIVAGGIGVGANINIGGNLKTYTSTGNVAFQALDTGVVEFRTPGAVAANSAGAFNIVGSTTGNYQPVTNAGGMIHITGNQGVASRITNDAFGTGANPVYVGRMARGTVDSPTPPQANDVLSRFTGLGWNGSGGYGPTAGTTAPCGMDFVAAETFSTTAQGSEIRFYNAPLTSNVRTLSATVASTGITVPGLVSVTGNVIGGNINTGGIVSATGNITGGNLSGTSIVGTLTTAAQTNITSVGTLTSLGVTGNVTGGNVLTGGLVSATGNVTGGNIVTAGLVSASNVTVSGSGGISLTDNGTMGYNAGAGGTVTQSGGGGKSAGVTLNKPSGEITMNNNPLAAATTVSFTLTNSTIGAHDVMVVNLVGGGTPGAYTIDVNCSAGSAVITVRNITAGSLSEALVLRYVLIKGSVT